MCSTVRTKRLASVILITRWLDLFLGLLMFYNVAMLVSGKPLKSIFGFLLPGGGREGERNKPNWNLGQSPKNGYL